MPNFLKYKRCYPWAFIALAAVALAFLYAKDKLQWELASIGTLAAFFHFLYSQHWREARMLRELFTEFNSRYDRLNDRLNALIERLNPNSLLGPGDKQLLYDYFNLCGEEYYFYKIGYIPDDVWVSWTLGMADFIFGHDVIKKLFEDETGRGSYYGLTLKEIEDKRAAQNHPLSNSMKKIFSVSILFLNIKITITKS
jgi:hypothetical protein